MLSTEYVAWIPAKDIVDFFLRGTFEGNINIPAKAFFTRFEAEKDHVAVYFNLEWKPYYRGEFEPPCPWHIFGEQE